MVDEGAEFFAGIAGAQLKDEKVNLGWGITLAQTYAQLWVGFFMHCDRALSLGSLPRRVIAAPGGFGFDIAIELYMPATFEPPYGASRLETVRWICTLLRLIHAPQLHAPIVSTHPFSEALTDDAVDLYPFELERRSLLARTGEALLTEQAIAWVINHWEPSLKLFRENPRFSLAVNAFDSGANSADYGLYLLSLWSGLEALFSPAEAELSFRISAAIAVFLEPPGKKRYELQKTVAKLYGVRSKITHGAKSRPDLTNSLLQTYTIMRTTLVKAIEKNGVPDPQQLTRELLGDI
jgi:hypothetical protein